MKALRVFVVKTIVAPTCYVVFNIFCNVVAIVRIVYKMVVVAVLPSKINIVSSGKFCDGTLKRVYVSAQCRDVPLARIVGPEAKIGRTQIA